MSRKGENIYKRRDNRWEGRYIKGYRPDGSAVFGYCYGKSYREAKEKLSEAKMLLVNGAQHPTERRKQRFSYFCDEWLLLHRDRVKQSTYVKYGNVIRKHINPRLGDYPVNVLNSLLIEEFSHSLLFEEMLSTKTVKDILVVLRSIVDYTGKELDGQLQNIDIVYPKVVKNEIRVLSKEEQKAFMNYLLRDMDEYKFGVALALLTGLRIGEICALRCGNVNLSEKSLQVRGTMQRLQNPWSENGAKTNVVVCDPKSDFSVRTIPLAGCALALCKTWRKGPDSAFLLTGDSDRFVEPRVLQYKLKKYIKCCGLEGVHFHTLRHTFATRCVEVNFEIKSLSEILGHSSPRITLERYVHSSMQLKRENMQKLSSIGF